VKPYLFSALLLVGVALQPASAQWLNYPTPGIPRTPDGKPNLSAPAPRTADGKIDLSGVWSTSQTRVRFAGDVPNAAPLTPWASAIREERQRNLSRDIPTSKCLPSGIPPDMLRQIPFKILQTPSVTAILIEEFNHWRQIFTDGRSLPVDPEPAWFGYSIGKWDRDILVVETTGLNDKTWIDGGGTPHSEALHLTERFKRPDFGHMEIEYTFDDPKAFSKSFSATVKFELLPDTELLDHECENEKDAGHLVGR
jgi:hypothetical protein